MNRVFLFTVAFFWTFACFAQTDSIEESRIFFYRPKNYYCSALNLRVKIKDDTTKFHLRNGSFYVLSTFKKEVEFNAGLINTGINKLVVLPGKDYYICIQPIGSTTVQASLTDSGTATKAINTIRLGKEVSAQKNQKVTEKIIEHKHLEPFPDEEKDMSQIYLYRTNDIIGSAIPFKIRIEDSVFIFGTGSSYIYKTLADSVYIETFNQQQRFNNSELTLPLQKGKVYYVFVDISGMSIKLLQLDKEIAYRLIFHPLQDESKLKQVKKRQHLPYFPAADIAQIYVYRPYIEYGSSILDIEYNSIPMRLTVNDSIYEFKGNTSCIIDAVSDTITINYYTTSIYWHDVSIKLPVEKEKVYYIRVCPGKDMITEVTEDDAQQWR